MSYTSVFYVKRFYRVLALGTFMSLVLSFAFVKPSYADPVEYGIRGAIGGAIIGGIIDGGRGAGKLRSSGGQRDRLDAGRGGGDHRVTPSGGQPFAQRLC